MWRKQVSYVFMNTNNDFYLLLLFCCYCNTLCETILCSLNVLYLMFTPFIVLVCCSPFMSLSVSIKEINSDSKGRMLIIICTWAVLYITYKSKLTFYSWCSFKPSCITVFVIKSDIMDMRDDSWSFWNQSLRFCDPVTLTLTSTTMNTPHDTWRTNYNRS